MDVNDNGYYPLSHYSTSELRILITCLLELLLDKDVVVSSRYDSERLIYSCFNLLLLLKHSGYVGCIYLYD